VTPPAKPEPSLGALVCAHLASIGCPQPPLCAEAFDVHHGKLYNLRPSCLLEADSAAAAQACRTVDCDAH